jgi:hypothetical protein
MIFIDNRARLETTVLAALLRKFKACTNVRKRTRNVRTPARHPHATLAVQRSLSVTRPAPRLT